MRNILITGGAGFIGSKLALKLNSQDFNITILDNLSSQVHGNNPLLTSPLFRSIVNADIKFLQGSVTCKSDWLNAIKDVDLVVHLASETGTGQSMYQVHKYCNTNILGTAHLFDILTNDRHSIKKVILASSRAVYGEGRYQCEEHGDVFPEARKKYDLMNGSFDCCCPLCNKKVIVKETDENSKIQPTSIYGITKQNQEEIITVMGNAIGIPTVSLRYQNVYGPGQSLSNPYTGILSIFSNHFLNNNDVNVFEDGYESRDFVYIDDAVDATILAMNNKSENCKIYNVGSSERTDLLTVANKLKSEFNSESSIKITGDFRIGDIYINKISTFIPVFKNVNVIIV